MRKAITLTTSSLLILSVTAFSLGTGGVLAHEHNMIRLSSSHLHTSKPISQLPEALKSGVLRTERRRLPCAATPREFRSARLIATARSSKAAMPSR